MARLTPEGWQPSAEREQISDAVYQYTINPTNFQDDSSLDDLELHASHYGIPFARSKEHQDSLISRTLGEVGKGFFEGITANLWKGEPPAPSDNVAKIARQLGSVAGFMGYIPGRKYLPILSKVKNLSLPMYASTKATKAVGKAINPLIKQTNKEVKDFLTGSVISDVVQGGFQMGVASAVSGEWKDGVSTILKNAGYGSLYGGVARGIGNMKGFGKRITVDQLDKSTGTPKLSKLADGQKIDLSMRVLANGTFDALSAKMQGQTTPEQVYNFIMGGFLGWRDLPLSTRTSQEFIWKTLRDKTIEDPELHPDWENYTPEMHEIIKKDMDFYFGPKKELRGVLAKLLENKGIISEEEFYKSIGKELGADFEKGPDGVPIKKLTNEDVEEYVKDYTDNGATKDLDDLDMHISDVRDLVGKGQPVVNWVSSHLKPKNEFEKIGMSADLFAQWKRYFEQGEDGVKPKDNAENEMYRYINGKFGIKLNDEGKGWWRRFAEEQRKRIFVPQLTVVDGVASFLSGNINAVGNKKDVHFQRPIIGDVLYSQYPETVGKDFFTYLDHIIYNGKEYTIRGAEKGIFRDLIQKAENERKGPLEKEEIGFIAEQSESIFKSNIDAVNKRLDKEGYYYVGGKGDKDAMYFVQKHPFIANKKNKDGKGTLQVLKALYQHSKANGFTKKPNVEGFIKELELDTQYLKDSVASNVLYDMTWNGFKIADQLKSGDVRTTTLIKDLLSVMKNSGKFLNSAKAYNKRAQIWFNTGISSNADNVSKLIKSVPVVNGNLKIKIFDDDKKGNLVGRGDTQTEFTDGAILGLKDVIKALNIDKGMPTDGNVNKSFIVSPDESYGALLGKYMIHEPSKATSDKMKKEGVHLLLPESAVKQMGFRKFDTVYDLPIEHIRTTMSEITSSKYIKPQRLPKQMMTVLSAVDGNNSDLFKQMYEDFSGASKNGTEQGRNILEKFKLDPAKNEKDLIDNYDEIPISQLFDIIRNPNYESASAGLMQKILKIQDDHYRNTAEESEYSRDELSEERISLVEYNTIVERLASLYPKGSTGGLMHKFIRDFRMVALKNYAVHSATRPKLKGSAVARIRPWDEGMKSTMDDINNDSNKVFYLDNGHKKIPLYDSRFKNGEATLEEVFNMSKDKNLNKDDVEDYKEMIRGVLTRVPMDSMSGANVLRLGGFTGIDGYGVLMHPRVMRALGGADLDGDKAFVFFGGEGGMKPEYKKMYEEARDEFFETKGNKLGTETAPSGGNVVIDLSKGKKPQSGAVVAFRTRGKSEKDMIGALDDNVVGNPFGPYAKIKEKEGKAVNRFLKWLEGTGDISIMQDYRNALLAKTNELKGKTIFYYKDLKRPSHATALDYFLNKPNFVKSKSREMHNKDEKDKLNPKKTVRELFTVSDKDYLGKASNNANYYNPIWRKAMSDGASSGRDVLGTAVNTRSAILGAYNAITNMVSKVNKVELFRLMEDGSRGKTIIKKDKKGNISYILNYKSSYNRKDGSVGYFSKRIIMDLKPENMDVFKQRSRAAIAIGSDPMDEAGVKPAKDFKQLMLEPLFDIKQEVYEKGKYVPDEYSQNLINLLPKTLIGDFLSVNSALYGKNSATGLRYTYSDIKSIISKLTKLPKSAENNVMVNLAKDINDINWSDNLFRKVDRRALGQMYQEHKDNLDKFEWLKPILNRTTFAVKPSRIAEYVFGKNMWSDIHLKKYLENDEAWADLFLNSPKNNYNELDVPYNLKANTTYKRTLESWMKEDDIVKAISPEWRSSWIDYMVLKSEDFLINDMSDITTINRIVDIVKEGNINPARIDEIFKRAEYIKNQSYHKMQNRKSQVDKLEFDFIGHNERTINDISDFKTSTDKVSAGADNVLIDIMIKDFIKDKELNTKEKELFDTMLMGSLTRGDLKKEQTLKKNIRKLKKGRNWGGKKAQYQEALLKDLQKDAESTSLMKVGLNSKVVSNENIKKYFDEYEKLFKKSSTKLTDEEIKRIEESLLSDKGSDKIVDLLTANGKRVEGSILEQSDLDKAQRRFLDELDPFLNLGKPDIKDPEINELYLDLKRHLDNMHNVDAKNINWLFRTVAGKNINLANKIDLEAFRNYLDDMNTPSFWRRSWDYITGKNPTEIKRAYYMQFPATVDKDLATSPAFRQLQEGISPYKDRLGNTIMGKNLTPITPMGLIQQFSAKATEVSQQVIQNEKSELRDKLLPYLDGIENGRDLYDIAVAMREKTIANKRFKNDKIFLSEYIENWNEVKPLWNKLRNQTYRVPLKTGVQIMKGSDVVNNINNIITIQNQKVHQWLTGDGKSANRFLDMARNKEGRVTYGGLVVLRRAWNKEVAKLLKDGKPIPIEKYGIDGIRLISKHIVQSHIPLKLIKEGGWKKLREINRRLDFQMSEYTGKYDYSEYFPHIGLDKKKAKERYEYAIKTLNERDLTKKEKDVEIKKIFTQYKKLTGDYMSKDMMGENYDRVEDIITAFAQNNQTHANRILSNELVKVGSQFSRESHIGGWSRTPEAYDAYMKNIIDTFYRQAMQTANRSTIHEFGEKFFRKTKDAELTTAWRRFFSLYANQAMGYPSHIPQQVMDDPLMKLSYTPYKFMSDSQTKKRVDFIRKKLNIDRKQLKEFDLSEDVIDDVTGVSYAQLESMSAVEAKWQLASLLAHPKSAVANFYGGSVHTVINTGWSTFKNARSIEYLKAKVNSKWNSMSDVEDWLQKLGVTEDFLQYEVGLNPNQKDSNLAKMANDVGNRLKVGKKVGPKELLEIKNKYNLSASAFKFASSFMRVPERALRRDAFMAHYLQARERFGNAIKDHDHPFLIEMAKKGVKATQFLYSAPYRPAWTTSAMGKIFSRFQLWSWNSVRFRRDILKRAKIYGFVPGTEAHDNAIRMMQADAFMLGMASVYTYSLFESALPAPYNWLQDTADYFFGDEKTKDRAFFGSPLGPFQLITPPFLRAMPQLFKWMVNKDQEIMTEYVAWSLFPFGRIGRDILGKGGIIENPYYAVNKMTGLPLIDVAGDLKPIFPYLGRKKEQEDD